MFDKKQITGTRVLGLSNSEFHTRRQMLRLEFTPKVWWLHPTALAFIFICLVAADVASLFNILNAALTENYLLLWLMVISISLMFIIIPSILAYTSRQRSPKNNKPPLSHVFIPAVMLMVLFAGVSFLRFAARDSAFAQSSLIMSVNTAGGTSQSADSSLISIALTTVFCLAILCTAVISWRIGWEISNPIQHEIKKLKKQKCENMEKLNELVVTQAGYEAMAQSAYSRARMDRDKYEAAVAIVKAQHDYLRGYVRVCLMQELKNPVATSMLADLPELDRSIDENYINMPIKEEIKV